MKKLISSAAAALMMGCGTAQPPVSPTGAEIRADASPATQPVNLDAIPSTSPATLASPVKLGVVELDGIAPSVAIVDRLRARTNLFTLVECLPDGAGSDDKSSATTVDRMTRLGQTLSDLRQQAAGQGLNTLLVLGSDVNARANSTVLGVFDLTIIGCWIVPSRQVLGDGRGLAELIDVQSGKVLMTVSADQSDWTFVPCAVESDAQYNIRLAITEKLNSELVDRITAKLAATK